MPEYAEPGAPITSRLILDNTQTGLTGTLRFRILNDDTTIDDPVYGPTTTNIIEDPTGSGSYLWTGTAPTTKGKYFPIWDTGPGTDLLPDEDLIVTRTAVVPVLPTDSFATADDLANRLGIELTDEEETRAETLIALASDLIRGEAKQTISLVEDDTLTMPGTTDERITLPERPVVEVASVTLGDAALVEGADWYLDRNTIVRLSRTVARIGWLVDDTWPLATGFGVPTRTLEITYTHGYPADELPMIVKAICLESVIRAWVNPGSVAREQVGDTHTVYDNMRFSPTGLLLTDNECEQLHRFFGNVARSITIGG